MTNDFSIATGSAPENRSLDEPLDEGGTWLLDLVAAVDHLGRGARPHLTVWDAIAEAAAWAQSDTGPDVGAEVFDKVLRGLLGEESGGGAAGLQRAIRRWVVAMAARYNEGHHWPHPAPRRGFPTPRVDAGNAP
jgi:hypothetical protein